MMMIESYVWNRKLDSATRAALQRTINQLTKLVIYLSLPPEFFDNLADHGMLGINPWSFKPLAGVNSKPE
jgi:glucose-6-phosphate 1-dehydrogenase